MATRGREDRTRDFFRARRTRVRSTPGIELPAEYDAKIRLLENFSPKTLNDDKAVRDWIDMFTMWPTKLTPGLRAQIDDRAGRATGCRPTGASRRRCW